MVDEHDSPQMYDIVHFEDKLYRGAKKGREGWSFSHFWHSGLLA